VNHLLPLLLLAEVDAKAPKPGDWRFGWDRVALVAVGAFAIVTVAWIVMRLVARRERTAHQSPWCLFKDLCTAHELSPRERQLMTRLAQHHRLEHPTELFVEPTWWEPRRLGPAWSKCLTELERLRKRLFAIR
jgi:hypothetical protein